MRIVIIGTGNTATVLGRLIKRAGHTIVAICGRNANHVQQLADLLEAEPVSVPGNIQADLFILAVSDSAIPELARSFVIDKGILVHTAGSVDRDVLKDASKNYGVLYPLQSLRKEMKDLPVVPLLVDANTPDDLTLLKDFATTISPHVQYANDKQRKHLHLGAVLVNNFPNYLFAKTHDYCLQQQVDFKLLLPLIQESASRLRLLSPLQTQTGPAIRRDTATIKAHLHLLEQDPDLKNLYEQFTEYIQTYFAE